MPAPATVPEFLDLVQKSGVAEQSRTAPYVEKLAAAGTLPAEPSKFAGLMVRDGFLTYFQAEQLLQGKWKRFFIGKYKVLEKIGSGGMGQVFLCEHKIMRRRVAVKVLPTAKAADPSSLERFYREARAVAALDHPNIVRAYDIDQDDNLHFLVMEFVDGANLHDLVRKFGPMDVPRACHYAYGSAVGLQYAFEQGIVHRDIKPANILVDRNGVVKVLDMGLARFFNDDDDMLTKKYDENILGTADYLAPEQAVDSHTVDIRADIYSLGGTFYYMLTGSAPFPDGTVAQKLLWHQTREPRDAKALRPEIPDDLLAVLHKMMAKDPATRYATPADLMGALAPWVQTPIPPPQDREMPQLSPAAAGGGTIGLAGRSQSGAMFPTLVPGKFGSSSGSGGLVAPPPAAVAVEAPPATPDAAPAPPGVWEALAAETAAVAATDTKPEAADAAPAARPAPRRPAGPGKPRRLVLVAAGVVAALVLAGGGYAAYRVAFPPPAVKPPPAAAEARKWYVTKSAGSPAPDRTFPTLVDALNKAGTGDTIVLLEDLADEPAVRFDVTRSKVSDVTIETENPLKTVKWTPVAPKGKAPAAAFEVVGIDGFKLRNVAIHAQGRYDFGLMLTGTTAGALVEDVEVRGAAVAAVRVLAGAAKGRPVVLNRVRVLLDAADVGVLFAGTGRLGCKGVRFTNGRVEGPGNVGVRVESPAADVEISHTRFFGTNVGVAVAAPFPDDRQAVQLRAAGNTFHSMKTACVRLETPLPAGPHDITLAQNFFAASAAAIESPDGKFPGLKADGNARDAATKPGNVPATLADVGAAAVTSNDPAENQFLLYPKASPLATAAPGNQPVGVPPQ